MIGPRIAQRIPRQLRAADPRAAANVAASVAIVATCGAVASGGAVATARAELVLALSVAALAVGGARGEDTPAHAVRWAGWLAAGAALLTIGATFAGGISVAAALLPLVMSASGARAGALREEAPEARRWHLAATTAAVVWMLVPYGHVARWASIALTTAVGMSLRNRTADVYSHDGTRASGERQPLRATRSIGRGTVLTLAAGVTAAVFAFTAITTALLRPLPYANAKRLVVLQAAPDNGRTSVSYSEFSDYRAQLRTVAPLAAFTVRAFNFAGGGSAEAVSLRGAIVSPNLFAALGARPALGRGFFAAQENAGAASEMIISYGLWTRRFGGDIRILGRPVKLDDRPFTIVGVMPRDFRFPAGMVFGAADVWVPTGMLTAADRAAREGRSDVVAVGPLVPGAALEDARREMLTVSARLAAQHPASGAHASVVADDATDAMVGPIRTPRLLLLAAAMVALAMVCGNIATRVAAHRRTSGEHQALLTAKVTLSAVAVVAGGSLAFGLWSAFGGATDRNPHGPLTAFVSVAYAASMLAFVAIAMYAVVMYRTISRVSDAGGRSVLDAASRQVVDRIVTEGGPLLCAAVVAGVGGAVAASGLLRDTLTGAPTADVRMYAAVATAGVVLAGVATVVSSFRASRTILNTGAHRRAL